MNEIIYREEKEVEMWSDYYYSCRIVTIIRKYEFCGFHFYRIKQNNPRIKYPVYDGEFASNFRLKRERKLERMKAKTFLQTILL